MNAKGDVMEAIENILNEQIQLYEKYAEHLADDQNLMARLQVDEIEKSNKQKQTLLLKVQALDEARKAYVKNWAEARGVFESNVKLDDLCKDADSNATLRLLKIRERLHQTISAVRKVQEETTLLAHTSLAWINSSMATLRGMLSPTGIYNLQGRVDHPQVFSGRVLEKQA